MSKITAKSDVEARSLLIGHGIQYFRVKGGFIAGNAPTDECGSCYCEWGIWRKYLFAWHGELIDSYHAPYDNPDYFGDIVCLVGHASCCFECAYGFNRVLARDDVYIVSWIADDYCQLCGVWCDGIPF